MSRLSADQQIRRQELIEAASGWHSWGIWVADHDGREIFAENLTRAKRRKSVLSQLAAGRRRRAACRAAR
ncbi:hypothetical protein [Kitasatospora sp. NPDC001132]